MIKIALLVSLLSVTAVNAATLSPVYDNEAANAGFNDPLLGVQRKAAFQRALNIWGGVLRSTQTIKVVATFGSLPCASGNVRVGAGEPISYIKDFANAPFQNTLYPAALAEAIARNNLNGTGNEIVVRFNSGIDQGCAGGISGFDYNINPQQATASGKIRVLPVMLHEIAHGLGFFTTVCLISSGCSSSPVPWVYGGYPNSERDIWSKFLRNGPFGNVWEDLNNAGRIDSASNNQLVWDGPRLNSAALTQTLNPASMTNGRLKMLSPSLISSATSVNHFTGHPSDNLLMMPNYNSSQDIEKLDLTPFLLADIGWSLRTSCKTPIFREIPNSQFESNKLTYMIAYITAFLTRKFPQLPRFVPFSGVLPEIRAQLSYKCPARHL